MGRYLITGASTFSVSNAGDDAMLWSIVRGLRISDPGCDIVLVCRHPSQALERALKIRTISNIDHTSKSASLGRHFLGFNPGDSHEHLDALRRELEAADAVILAGNLFMEISVNEFMRGVASYALMMGQWALLFGKPLYITGMAIHPRIANEYTREIARFLCANARRVQVREEFSRKCLADIGVTETKVEVMGDPAFGIPIISAEIGWKVLADSGIRPKRRLIGFNWRMLYWKADESSVSREVQIAARACDELCERLDAELLFLPNCTYGVDTPAEDDRTHHRAIVEQMKHKSRTHLWEREALVTEILPIFSVLDLHIANRRHACIFAAVQGVPFISLVTEATQHFAPFLSDLGLSKQSIEIRNLEPQDLTNLAVLTLESSDKIKATLKASTSRLADLTRRAMDSIVNDTLRIS